MPLHQFIPYMIVLMFMIGFLILQPDLGGALTLAAVAMTMLFAAGTRLTYIFSMFLLALPLLAYKLSRGYHKSRIDDDHHEPEVS